MDPRAPSPDVTATIAYLRFPLRAEHGGGLRDGSACPYCQRSRVQKWGRFDGRQRFRCRDCGRTHSTFTGTPLYHLKRADRWRVFLWCMEGRLTVRRTGAVAGVHRNTALRWRHRLLDHWRLEPRRRLRGCVAVDQFRMPRNEKGSRGLDRAPRKHGHAPGRWGRRPEWVGLVAALEEDAPGAPALAIGSTDVHPIDQADIARVLGPRLGAAVAEITGRRGPLCALARFAGQASLAYRVARLGQPSANVTRVRLELRRWLRPLRGVATHRLDNYLEWFRRDYPAIARLPTPQAPGANSSRRQSQSHASRRDPLRRSGARVLLAPRGARRSRATRVDRPDVD